MHGRKAAYWRVLAFALALLAPVWLAGCVSQSPPDNLKLALYDPEKTAVSHRHGVLSFASKTCPPPGTPDFLMPPSPHATRRPDLRHLTMRYSPGDRFNMFIFGATEMSGDYAVNADGTVILPYSGAVDAVGLTNAELSSRIETAMVRAGIFTRDAVKIALRPVQYAPINVTVSGAVFFSGRHTIGGIRDSDKLDRAMSKFGDNPMERFVPAALRAAGGVRPDADLSKIKVSRRGKTYVLNWQGAITGGPVDDMPLIEGDHVDVGESGCFQSAMLRPSQITPQGVRIFTSNLTVPSLISTQSGNPQLANSMPYGTRLLQGLVQASCVGGTLTTNAGRYGVLISRNPKTRETEVVQRSIEELVRSADRDMINPYLMPDDAIACYDSTVTEFRDVMTTLQTALTPLLSIKTLLAPFPK